MKFKTLTKAFTLIELLVVVAIIGILTTIAVPNFLNALLRAQIAKTNGDMDAMVKAMMAFRLDHNRFPYATDNIGESYVSDRVDPADAQEFFTFQINHTGQPVPHLTSPVAYLSFPPLDPFSTTPTLPYGYAGGKDGYIVTSFGPDRDQQEGINDFFHRGDIDEPSSFLRNANERFHASLINAFQGATERSSSPGNLLFYLVPRSYNPSNGLLSNGDIWRSNL